MIEEAAVDSEAIPKERNHPLNDSAREDNEARIRWAISFPKLSFHFKLCRQGSRAATRMSLNASRIVRRDVRACIASRLLFGSPTPLAQRSGVQQVERVKRFERSESQHWECWPVCRWRQYIALFLLRFVHGVRDCERFGRFRTLSSRRLALR